MTWQERRVITILCTILALLFAALLIVLGIRHREKLALQEQQRLDSAAPVVDETVEETRYTALSYFNGAATLSFARGEDGHWLWSDDTAFPLDESIVLAILKELDAWSPQQTLTDAASLEKAGLTQPSASLTATTNTGTVATLLFGQTTDDGNSYYVRLNGDESTVYIISDALYKLMETPIYDMCVVPELPVLPETSIRVILLAGPQAPDTQYPAQLSTITAQHTDDNRPTIWSYGNDNVSNHKLFRDLLADLEHLSFTRCVIYRPSDEAATICGFDTPTAVLTVSYSSDSGEDQRMTLTIGNRLPDESGRYVRLNDDPSIYLLETAFLDPLMHLAVVGLEND